jgi:hypothetical protein
MKKHLLIVCGAVLCLATSLQASEEITETQYFVDGFKPEFKLPTPTASWKLHFRKKTLLGAKAVGIEYLEGSQKGTSSWAVGKHVVAIPKTGKPNVYEKALGDTSIWQAPDTNITWFKNQEPVHKEKHNGRELLIYDAGNGFRRIWIDAETQLPLAQVEGRMVTFYERKKTDADIEAPEAATKALAENKRQEQMLGEYGAMPK